MQYRDFCGEKVSVLGYGCMRFPTVDNKIDFEKSEELVEYAFENGVNYYDTAYMYHNGESEVFLGRTMIKNHRKDIFLADKFPVWLAPSEDGFERVFEEQCKRLGTDYFDFYLMHALDRENWDMIKKFGVLEKAARLKEEGKIRHLGFSFHDSIEVFKEIIDSWDGWEFCQIQLNYINIDHQAGIEGLEYTHKKGLDVIIMEPLLGGRLANPPAQVKKVLGGRNPVQIALSFLWNRPEIKLVLSGMGAAEQVRDNIEYADRAKVGMLSEEELAALAEAKRVFDSKPFVECTGCNYCMPCPAGLDIPAIYSLYNRTAWHGKDEAKKSYASLSVKADSCIECGACLAHCPQHIDSPSIMKDVVRAFE